MLKDQKETLPLKSAYAIRLRKMVTHYVISTDDDKLRTISESIK